MKQWSRLVAAGVLAATTSWFMSGLVADDQVILPKQGPFSMPLPGGTVSGFTANVEIGDSGAPGYVAIQIDVNAIGTFTADRRFTFVLEPPIGGCSPPVNALVCELPINVSQGDKSKHVVRYVPKWSVGDAYTLQVFEDNQPLEDYLIDFGTPLRPRRRAPTEPIDIQNQVQWLFIQNTDHFDLDVLPNVNTLILSLFDAELAAKSMAQPELYKVFKGQQLDGWKKNLTVTGRLDLPTDWRGFARHDAVVISEQTIEHLSTNEAASFGALRDWVLNGGTVVAYDAASDRSTAQWLGFPASPVPGISLVESAANKVQTKFSGPRVKMDFNSPDFPQYYKPSQWADRISAIPLGAGMVIGLQDDTASEFPNLFYWSIVVELVDLRRSPALRYGVDPLIGDGRFRRWLIPGVAQPPVYTFMALLTCFVILVGPIAYRRTTKYGRGYLMFAIAPVLAITTTLAMFGYGIVADGFGTTARIRQLTWIDGASGDAGERVRATYFAGVRPADGLTFPPDAEVYHYPENHGESWEERNQMSWSSLGRIRITDQGQEFDSAFLPSRQQRQFVIHQPRRQIGRLVVTQKMGLPPKVSSSLGFAIRDLVIRDHRGHYWSAAHVRSEATEICTKLASKEASKALGSLYNRYRPISEIGDARQRSNYRNETRDVIMTANRDIFSSSTIITDGVLEHWLQTNLQTKGELPRGTFVALADVSQDVIVVTETELVESVRYVFGTLP